MQTSTMIRRGAAALVVAALGAGSLLAPAQASSPDANVVTGNIVNISVGASALAPGNAILYNLCVAAPSPPTAGGIVTIQGPDGTMRSAGLTYSASRGLCGQPGVYLMTAQFTTNSSWPSGTYTFQAACVLPTPSWVAPCVSRQSGLSTNFQGQTVASQCQIDFTMTGPGMPFQNCNGGVGNLTNGSPAPGPTTPPAPTSTPAPTNTPALEARLRDRRSRALTRARNSAGS